MRIPIGVVATIYESRPNVTVDIASICIKTIFCIFRQANLACFNCSSIIISSLLLLRLDYLHELLHHNLSDLKDCIGETVRKIERPNGLIIKQVRIPIGVVATIYESRPSLSIYK